MSEQLAAAAAAMGLPEALVERSAAARAAESGASSEELLTQWAGGEAAPVVASTEEVPSEAGEAEPVGESQPEPDSESDPVSPTPEVVVEIPEPARADLPTEPVGPYRAPVLVGVSDNPMTILAGVVGLFVLVLLVGLLGPSISADNPGARTSQVGFSDSAIEGRSVYASTGCAACHSQMVRPVIADVGLGAVTLNDSDQILGTRRFGPDLSDVASRLSDSQIEATIGGLGGHPVHRLGPQDLASLVAYLSESETAPATAEGGS